MKNIAEALEDSRRLGLEFCRIELELANAILDHAEQERSQRPEDSLARATIARDTVQHMLPRFASSPEADTLRDELERLDRRLAADSVSAAARPSGGPRKPSRLR